MATEEWTVHALLTGEFFITDERRSSQAPVVEGLRELTISPQLDDDGKWTGLHELDAVLALEDENDAPLASRIVHERGRALVDSITALATLGIGRPVRVSGGVSAKHRLAGEPPKYRLVTGVTQTADIAPPTPLPAELLTMAIDSRQQRVIRWWARGMAANDVIDRLVALNNALDLLAGMTEGAAGRVRRCKSCGAEEPIGPGLRDRIMYFLTTVPEYPEATAKDVYESRLDLAHARSDLGEDDLRRYRELADLVAAAVRTGIANVLGVTLPEIPERLPFDLPSALLDIEYVEGDKP
jgi:hypothetical protein